MFADNQISDLRRSDLRPLSSSLRVLDLSGNSLSSVPEGIFWDLQRLERLDLSRNNIIQIHSMAFQNGVSDSAPDSCTTTYSRYFGPCLKVKWAISAITHEVN